MAEKVDKISKKILFIVIRFDDSDERISVKIVYNFSNNTTSYLKFAKDHKPRKDLLESVYAVRPTSEIFSGRHDEQSSDQANVLP